MYDITLKELGNLIELSKPLYDITLKESDQLSTVCVWGDLMSVGVEY